MAARTVMVVMGSHFLTEAHEAAGKQEKYQRDEKEKRVHVKPPADDAQYGVSLCGGAISLIGHALVRRGLRG